MAYTTPLQIQVLGSGCAPCTTMKRNVQQAVDELDLGCEVESVTRLARFIELGIAQTPAFVVNGVVHSVGTVLSVAEIKTVLQNAARLP